MASGIDTRKRWLALMVLCLGDFMIVLDTTCVNVALPSIREDLGFSQTSLVWVVNAYMLTYGGFLLLGGRSAICMGNAVCFSSASCCSLLHRSPASWPTRRPC